MSSILILIVISLICFGVFVFVSILTLNYAMYTWESDKISKLTDKIKPSEKSILNKRLALPSSKPIVDISKSSKKKAIKAVSKASKKANKIYQNSLSGVKKGDYPQWVDSSLSEVNKFRSNSVKYSKKLVAHLISLTKPIEEVQAEEEKKTLTEKIMKRLPGQSNTSIYADGYEEKEVRVKKAQKDIASTKEEKEVIQEISQEQEAHQATLGLASNLKTENKEDAGLFEKIETKLLAKLQDSGMADYDIWLDLGDLYAKYGEDRKAKEIYALVLKHAQEKSLKERATNKLIGL